VWRLEVAERRERFTVLNFLFPPSWKFTPVRGWNHSRWASAVHNYLDAQGISVDVLWLSSPEQIPFYKKIPARLVCYDCMDNYESFFSWLEPLEKKLFRRADVVFVSAPLLEEKAKKYTGNVHLVPNGVDVESFSKVLDIPYDLPGDLADIPSPRIGYYGSIADWIDYEILEALRRETGASIVLIGPVHSERARQLERLGVVHLLGVKPYLDLPAYLAHFSVCILPFRDTEMTRAVDPVKVYEYLAAGMDIVATPLPTLEPHSKLLVVASPDRFCEAVRNALRHPSPPEIRAGRSAAMSPHSWENRIERIIAALAGAGGL
jgi:glycosyltransferase involved in cell wall biosynthesis